MVIMQESFLCSMAHTTCFWWDKAAERTLAKQDDLFLSCVLGKDESCCPLNPHSFPGLTSLLSMMCSSLRENFSQWLAHLLILASPRRLETVFLWFLGRHQRAMTSTTFCGVIQDQNLPNWQKIAPSSQSKALLSWKFFQIWSKLAVSLC